jgi:hypothetical protein
MRSFRRIVPVVLSVSGFAAACIGASAGCGSGDDTTSSVPSVDAGPDGTLTSPDAATDGGGGKPNDASVSPDVDAGHSTPDADSGTSIVDADASIQEPDSTPPLKDATPGAEDAGSDAADSAVIYFDAGEAGITAATFATEVATAICDAFARCCSIPSGMTFNTAGCITQQTPLNFNLGVNLADSGDVVLDQTKAQACLNDLLSVNCADRTGTVAIQEFSDCYGAMFGTLATGAGCVGSVECNPNDFCDTPLDGGAVGTCQPLRTQGEPCGDFGTQDPTRAQEACSYRGSGNDGLRCADLDLNTAAELDAASWVCSPQFEAGSNCINNVDCVTRLCDPGPNRNLYECTDNETYVYPFVCEAYLVDGG